MNANENITEVDRLREMREQLRAEHKAVIERKIEDAISGLAVAIVNIGHEVKRQEIRHQDAEGNVTVELGQIEYIDHVYFGECEFYEQGAKDNGWKYIPGNGKLAFKFRDPVEYENKIVRERKRVEGGFDFVSLAAMLCKMAAPAIPAALEKEAEQAKRDAEYKLQRDRHDAASALSKEAKAGLTDERIKGFGISSANWGRSEGVSFEFYVDDIETARAIVREYFSKQ